MLLQLIAQFFSQFSESAKIPYVTNCPAGTISALMPHAWNSNDSNLLLL